jgi:hypothetical protein
LGPSDLSQNYFFLMKDFLIIQIILKICRPRGEGGSNNTKPSIHTT